MTSLARSIYRLLVARLGEDDARISYKELGIALRELSDEFEHINQRSHSMYTALAEVSEVCRERKLPCLAALVVRSDSRRPGEAYFHGMASPYRGERIQAWREEVEAVRQAEYPEEVE